MSKVRKQDRTGASFWISRLFSVQSVQRTASRIFEAPRSNAPEASAAHKVSPQRAKPDEAAERPDERGDL